MSQRSTIIEVTARLLAEATGPDIATRAICEAAGVQQPVLYRLFGDKDGLLTATVDHAFEGYLASKRAAVASPDPVADLRAGWDAHTGFALANPNSYRLMFGPGLKHEPAAIAASHDLLATVVDRVSSVGRLRVQSAVAVRAIMSANTGTALALITRPEMYPDSSISEDVREITFAGLLTAETSAPADDAWTSALSTITSTIANHPPTTMTAAELGLFTEWLHRIAPRP